MKWAIFIVLILLVGCSRQPPAKDYVECGIYAHCPEGYNTSFIGGQCMRCYIPSEIIYINYIATDTLGNRTQESGCTYNGVYPDYDCSPGAIFQNATKEIICVSGYTKTVRDVPDSLKKKVYESYGIYTGQPYEYEMDHIISLELGGSNDIANLYPEKYNQTNGARDKDKIENLFHKKVCDGTMTLREAQYQILYNWTAWT